MRDEDQQLGETGTLEGTGGGGGGGGGGGARETTSEPALVLSGEHRVLVKCLSDVLGYLLV